MSAARRLEGGSASARVRLATGPVSWGVDFADTPTNPPWQTVLDEIAGTGLGTLELGPVGYLPEDPALLREELARRRLRAVGSFVFEDLHDPSAHAAILATADRACRAIAAAGGAVLVIIDRVSAEREATFGRSAEARRLDPAEWRHMLTCVRRVAELAASHGLEPAFHPHAGGYVEFEDEIDRLMDDTDLGLCLDTGHSALADVDVPALLARHGERLRHVHLKDVDGAVLSAARAQRMSFWDAVAAGVFCPIGRGVVDFSAIARLLAEVAYEGFATIEQDRTPGAGSPLADVLASVEALAAAGFHHAREALDRTGARPAGHEGSA